MSDDTTTESESPEDNDIIRGLRRDLKDANARVKTAGEDAIAQVKRQDLSSSLMPEGFKGLADVFENEVDGELNAESANKWLEGRGITASSNQEPDEAAKKAAELERVTNLGGAVAAAGNLTPEDSVIKQLDEVLTPGEPQTLEEVTAAIAEILAG